MLYKRNQLEEAILRARGADDDWDELEVRVRIKRLLDVDRKQPVGPTTIFDQDFAFYSAESPGTGQDVLFSGYEVFAVWTGLKLLSSGFPQGRAVTLMRYYREALQREHEAIVTRDLGPVFRRSTFLKKRSTPAAQERLVSEGKAVEKLDDMVFLAINSGPEAFAISTRYREDKGYRRPTNICRGQKELFPFVELEGFSRHPVLLIELTNPAHQLAYWLGRIEPARRGRR